MSFIKCSSVLPEDEVTVFLIFPSEELKIPILRITTKKHSSTVACPKISLTNLIVHTAIRTSINRLNGLRKY
jgi:hypothetical protein